MSTVPLLSLSLQDMVILRGRRYHVRPTVSVTPLYSGPSCATQFPAHVVLDRKVSFLGSTSVQELLQEAVANRLKC